MLWKKGKRKKIKSCTCFDNQQHWLKGERIWPTICLTDHSVKKYGGTTKATFKISKTNTSNPSSPLNQCCESREWEKNKKLHMFWQPATLIKEGRRFVPLFFWLIVGKDLLNLSWATLARYLSMYVSNAPVLFSPAFTASTFSWISKVTEG